MTIGGKPIRTKYPFMNEITEEWQEKIRNGKCTSKTKVEFICQRSELNHPNYFQTLGNHLQKQGCPKCGDLIRTSKRIRTKYPFINELTPEWREKVLNGKCNSHTKVGFVCSKNRTHPNYMQTLTNHEFGTGCPVCWDENRSKICTRKFYPFMDEMTQEWKKKVYNGEVTIHDKVEFICQNEKEHHPNYFQSLHAHLHQEQSCPICAEEQRQITHRKKHYPFMNEITSSYQEKIRYGQINCRDKVEFICEKHGNYFQRLNDHSNGCGCPACNESRGEIRVRDYLESNNIVYIPQKTFDGCKFDKLLRFDFYVPSINTVIEYQGEQHYEPVSIFGGEKAFNLQQQKDAIKQDYCIKNEIGLIEIPYWDYERIESILNTALEMRDIA